MATWQKVLFCTLLIILITLILIFWGSVFSGIMVYCLVMALAGYLFNRFINRDRENEFSEDDDY